MKNKPIPKPWGREREGFIIPVVPNPKHPWYRKPGWIIIPDVGYRKAPKPGTYYPLMKKKK